jgi:hypothetical protein
MSLSKPTIIQFIKSNIINIVIVGLLYVLFLQKSDTNHQEIKIERDTVWHETSKTVVREMVPQVGGDEGHIPPNEDKYIASDSYDSLLTKFNTLVKELTARKFYKDSLQLDSIGYIVVKDTVQFNNLQKRSYDYFYKIPHITEKITITEYASPKSQLYVGGGFGANDLQAGLLYKTKKDLMLGVYISPPLQQNSLQYGFQAYWKIKLKK